MEWQTKGYFMMDGALRLDADRAVCVEAGLKKCACIFFGGGEGGDEVIPLIDYGSVAAHPKMWLGFSDGTSILSAINRRAGLPVLYGQSPGTLVEPSAYNAANFHAHVEEGCAPMHLKSGAWRTVTGGTASGTLSGGYLDNYVFLAASGWIAPRPGEDLILALEEHEMFFSVEHVSDSIGRLEQTPVMPHVRDILFGHYSDPTNEHLLFRLKLLGEKWDIPVAYTDDFGHGVNQAIFPFGARATLDTENAALAYSYR